MCIADFSKQRNNQPKQVPRGLIHRNICHFHFLSLSSLSLSQQFTISRGTLPLEMRNFVLLALLGLATSTSVNPRNYETNDYYVLHLDSATSPSEIASHFGLTHEGQLGELQDHHIFSAPLHEGDLVGETLQELKRKRKRSNSIRSPLDGIRFAQKQKLKPRMEKRVIPELRDSVSAELEIPRGPEGPASPAQQAAVERQNTLMTVLGINDPIFKAQWHLYNAVELGHDVNVSDVWTQGITGHNATVAIVDDGLDMYSDDLKGNYFAEGSYDFNDKGPEPRPRLSDDRHGTRCAGEVSAVKNDVCGVGVAWDSKVAGIRILSKQISDADEAVAMNYAFQHNQIYSCSWGPPDDGQSMDAPGVLIRRAMLNAVQNGRGGKGSIYVFASGNGAGHEDNCNFDGYTNSIYSITVGAVDRKGLHPYYSELCCAQLVVTYSSGSGDSIHTTDVGTNTCSDTHGGTSAAAPLAAGIFALVLSIRPDLTWRDLQYLVMQTAVPIDVETTEWQKTSIGKLFSHTFGYGKIDTWATIEAAKTFQNVKPQAWFFSPWIHINGSIPQGDQGLYTNFTVTAGMLKGANLARVEHVTVTMNVNHTKRGDLSVDLISPEKVVSHLSATRRFDSAASGYVDWTFMSVAHWGESGSGTWSVVVKDTVVNKHNGTFIDWRLKLWGESIEADKATLLPMPDEHDDDDHTITLPAATSTVSVLPAPTGTIPANPTDHPDRPTKPKPSSSTVASQTSSPTSSPTASASSIPIPPSSHANWLPSFFPTFGVSAKTQTWIYGALALILVFCTSLSVYLFLARRKRLRNDPREDYEFDLIEEDEAEGLTRGGNVKAGKKTKRRAGELYDAFADGSDDDIFSDDDEEETQELGYKDSHHVIGDDEESEAEGNEKQASEKS